MRILVRPFADAELLPRMMGRKKRYLSPFVITSVEALPCKYRRTLNLGENTAIKVSCAPSSAGAHNTLIAWSGLHG